MDRKSFIISIARGSILLAIASGVAILIKKDRIGGVAACSEDTVCGGCSRIAKCTLPEAQKWRRDG